MRFDVVPSAPPQNVACTALTGQNIQVTWKPPPSDKVHGVVQGYKLLYEASSGAASESQAGRETKISHALSTVLHALSPYTNYTVQVLAYTRAGEGVSSSPVSCTTEETGEKRTRSSRRFHVGHSRSTWLEIAAICRFITVFRLPLFGGIWQCGAIWSLFDRLPK